LYHYYYNITFILFRMNLFSALVALFLCLAIVQAVPVNVRTSVTNNELIRLRCSHNPDEETSFFFNGTVTAYMGDDSKGGVYTGPQSAGNLNIIPLFSAVGWNVAKCFKGANDVWYLVSREAMWYVNTQTENIIDRWTNNLGGPGFGESLTVMHVDNDPVMQTFRPNIPYPVQVYGDMTLLPSDVTQPLNYPNVLFGNDTFADYSPYRYYKAAELFKFISPTDEVFSNRDSTDSTMVAWTRTSQFLPWMKMGNVAGHLLYSFQGSKIPDWTYLPAQIKADIENRVPHYKHAPASKCFPNVGSVTSWTFFKENIDNYLAGVKFPLATPRQYGCSAAAAYVPAADTQCKAEAVLVSTGSWNSGNDNINQYNIVINNSGVKAVSTATITLNFAGEVKGSWNIDQVGTSNVYNVKLWGNPIQVGQSASGYGIQVTGTPTVSVAVTCA
jgi:hypothetical protein